MQEKFGMKHKLIYVLIIPLSIIAIAYLFFKSIEGNLGKQALEVKFGQNRSVKIDVENNQVLLKDILRKVRENTPEFNETKGTLKHFKFYKVNDQDIIDEIGKLQPTEPVAPRYRWLASKRKGPFQLNAQDIEISTPDHLTEKGIAAACSNSEYFNEKVNIFNSKAQNGRTVEVSESIGPCPSINGKRNPLLNLIQVSWNDAEFIFGNAVVNGKNKGLIMLTEPGAEFTVPHQRGV